MGLQLISFEFRDMHRFFQIDDISLDFELIHE